MLLDQITSMEGGSFGKDESNGVSDFSKGMQMLLGKFDSTLSSLDRIENQGKQRGGVISSFFAKETQLSVSRNNILGDIDKNIKLQTTELQKSFDTSLKAITVFNKSTSRSLTSIDGNLREIRVSLSSTNEAINRGNMLSKEILSEISSLRKGLLISKTQPSSASASSDLSIDLALDSVTNSINRTNSTLQSMERELINFNKTLIENYESVNENIEMLGQKIDALANRPIITRTRSTGSSSEQGPSVRIPTATPKSEGGSKLGRLAGIGMMLSSVLNVFGNTMASIDENFKSMPNKIAVVMGQNAKGESFDTYRTALKESAARNKGEGHLSKLTGGLIDSQLISVEEYQESMNEVLNTGIKTTKKLTDATAELALARKLMPDMAGMADSSYFKNTLESYEDGADRIRGVSMVIKEYSDNMWTTPTKLQETVNKYHSAIAAMSKDLTSYIKNMESYIKTKSRMDQAGLDLGVEDTVNKWATTSPTEWTSDMMLQMTSLGLDPGQMEKLSYQDPTKAMDYMIQGIDKSFSQFYDANGNVKTDVASMRAFNQKAQMAGFSGYQEITDLRAAVMKNGSIDKYNDTANADYASKITGASSQEAMVAAINDTATGKLSDQTNLSLSEEFGNAKDFYLSTGPIISDIYKELNSIGITSKEILFAAGLMTFKGSGGKFFSFLGKTKVGKLLAGSKVGQFVSGLFGRGAASTAASAAASSAATSAASAAASAAVPAAAEAASAGATAVASGGFLASLKGLFANLGSKIATGFGAVSTVASNAWSGIMSTGVGTGVAGGTAGAIASVVAPLAGGIWTIADGVSGWKNAAELTGKKQEDLDVGDKLSAAVGTALGGKGPGWGDEGSFADKAKNTLSGAAKGALIGSVAGPIGAAVGGAIGLVTSAIGSKNITNYLTGGKDFLKNQETDFSKMDAKQRGKEVAKTIPGVGQMIGLVDGIKAWDSKDGLAKNLGKVAAGVGSTLPVVGGLMKSVSQWDKEKSFGENLKNSASNVVSSIPIVGTIFTGLKSLFTPMDEAAEKLKESSDNLTGAADTMSETDKTAVDSAIKTVAAGTPVEYKDDYSKNIDLSSNPFAYTDMGALLPNAIDGSSSSAPSYGNITDTNQLNSAFPNPFSTTPSNNSVTTLANTGTGLMAETLGATTEGKDGVVSSMDVLTSSLDKLNATIGKSFTSDGLISNGSGEGITSKFKQGLQKLASPLGILGIASPGVGLGMGISKVASDLLSKDKDTSGQPSVFEGLAKKFSQFIPPSIGGAVSSVIGQPQPIPVGESAINEHEWIPNKGGDESNPVVSALVALQEAITSRLDKLSGDSKSASMRDKGVEAYPLRVPNVQGTRSIDSQDIRNYTR